MTEKKEVIIDLTLPLTIAHSRNKEANLQRNALKQVDQLLKKFIAYNQSDNKLDNTFILPRQNNTIYINGERGAGKTTFLLDVLKEYQETKLEANKIVSIDFIDPTLIQTNQNILIEIISTLYKKTNNHLPCGKDEEKKRELNQSLEKMSEGLKLLDIHNKNPKYQDSSWYLNKSLQDATSGQCLERNLHDFIDKCAELFKAELFVIAIDDVDTKTDKAYEVLEVIRCYLTHPKLAIIISGDLELYSHLVNNKKIEEISSENIKDYKDNKEMASHLEQQYLSKILPIEYRITLNKMTDIIRTNNVSIQYLCNKDGNSFTYKKKCDDFLCELLSSTLSIPLKHISNYKTFIFQQPIRSILQFLKDILDKSNISPKNVSSTPDVIKAASYNIFFSSMITDIQVNNLSSISTISYELFKILERNNDLETGFYGRPHDNISNIGFNASKFYITTTCSKFLANSTVPISDTLKMILLFGGSATIYANYVVSNFLPSYTFQTYLEYIGLSKGESINSIVSHFSPIILNQYNPNASKGSTQIGTKSGVIRTPKDYSASKYFHIKNFEKAFEGSRLEDENRVCTVNAIANFEKIQEVYLNNSKKNLIDFIAIQTVLLSSQTAIKTKGTEDYISSYSLLACMAEILSLDNQSIAEGVSKLSSSKNYLYPYFLKGIDQGDPDSIDSIQEFDESSGYQAPIETKALNMLLEKWVKALPKTNNANILMIGKIWTRIHYSLENISNEILDNKTAKQNLLLTELISRFIIAIINAFLIEEARYSAKQNIDIINSLSYARNPNQSAKTLIDNLKSVFKKQQIDFKQTLPTTYSIISCPLLWPFYTKQLSITLRDLNVIDIDGHLSIFNTEEYTEIFDIDNNLDFNDFTISLLPIMGCFRDSSTSYGLDINFLNKKINILKVRLDSIESSIEEIDELQSIKEDFDNVTNSILNNAEDLDDILNSLILLEIDIDCIEFDIQSKHEEEKLENLLAIADNAESILQFVEKYKEYLSIKSFQPKKEACINELINTFIFLIKDNLDNLNSVNYKELEKELLQLMKDIKSYLSGKKPKKRELNKISKKFSQLIDLLVKKK